MDANIVTAEQIPFLGRSDLKSMIFDLYERLEANRKFQMSLAEAIYLRYELLTKRAEMRPEERCFIDELKNPIGKSKPITISASPIVVQGVGKDSPTITNSKGGKQSDTPYRADLIPQRALLEIAKKLKEGAAKYDEENWRNIQINEHLNHALVHIMAYLAGDGQDDHLVNAGCRILFAGEIEHSVYV
jgi:putative NIF3 family GTP cyclohydrolase 1 type 2